MFEQLRLKNTRNLRKNEVNVQLKMVSFRQRSIIFLTFLTACLALALLAGSLGTQYWVVASAERESNNKSGFIHFGLFEGERRLNHGYGERKYPMKILDVLYHDRSFMIKDLYITTIGCICVSMLFGIIAAMSAIVNTASTPSEPICHIPGNFTKEFHLVIARIELEERAVTVQCKIYGNLLLPFSQKIT